MQTEECIKTRRSIRQFSDKKVDHDLLAEIVDTARFAPSWKNTQITRYIAVEGALKDKMAELATGDYPHNGEIIKSAPVLIAVTAIKNRSGYERDGSFSTPRGDGWQMFDAGIAAQTFCLTAWEKGLGTVIMGIFDRAQGEALLQLPEDRELMALIAAGYPAESPEAPKRKTTEELLSFSS